MEDTAASAVPMNCLSSSPVFKQYRKRSVPGKVGSAEKAPFCKNSTELNCALNDPHAVPHEGEKDLKKHYNSDVRGECEYSPCDASLSTVSSSNTNRIGKGDKVLEYLVACERTSPDWDRVNLETEQELLHNGCNGAVPSGASDVNSRNSSIGFLEAVRYLRSDSSAWEPYIVSNRLPREKKENCLFLFFTWCLRRPRGCIPLFYRSRADMDTDYTLQRDADFLSAMSSVPFDHGHVVHRRLLFSIHNALLNSDDNRTGSSRSTAMDWEKLGFQGCDPATDLRSSGVLGLIQLNYLLQYYPDFTKCLWATCTGNGEVQGEYDVYRDLPFVLIGFNFSSVVLDALKDPIFAEEIRKRARSAHRVVAHPDGTSLSQEFPLLYTCCNYYVGCLFIFYECWVQLKKQRKERPPTIGDFGVVKAKVCARIRKNGIEYVLDTSTRAHNLSHVNLHFSECKKDTIEVESSGTSVPFTSI